MQILKKSKNSTSYESPNIELIVAQRTRACGIIMRKHPYFSCSHTCLHYRVANNMKYSVWLATYQLYAIGDLFSSHHDHRRTNNPRAFCSKMAPYRTLNFIVCASTLLFITNGSSLPFLIWPAHLIVAFICRDIQDSFHAFFNVNCIEFHINIKLVHVLLYDIFVRYFGMISR